MLSHPSRTHRSLYLTLRRHFGGGGGGGVHYPRQKIYIRSEKAYMENATTKEDIEQETGKRTTKLLHKRFMMKVLAYTNPHRNHLMDNCRRETYSAYNWFSKLGIFRNQMLLKTMAWAFDTQQNKETSSYEEPVALHENSVFLYKSGEMNHWIGARVYDYIAFSSLVYGCFFAHMPLLWLPIIPYLAEFPKFMMYSKYVTLRADFLPHSEQVVFTKVRLFGTITHSIVDTKNLVKIEAQSIPEHVRLFKRLDLDSRFIWKDNSTGETFVFDSNGIWSEEGLNHPLLN